MKKCRKINQKIPFLFLLLLLCCLPALAQNGIKVNGVVVDRHDEPVIGATVMVKGNTSIGAITDIDGKFSLNIPNAKSMLVVSYIGMVAQDVRPVAGKLMKITLQDDTQQLEEVVVVGYGQQKKASVVGAITQTTGKVLERAAGVSDIGAALTGNLPGVITTQGTGMPGEEEPKITFAVPVRGTAASLLFL